MIHQRPYKSQWYRRHPTAIPWPTARRQDEYEPRETLVTQYLRPRAQARSVSASLEVEVGGFQRSLSDVNRVLGGSEGKLGLLQARFFHFVIGLGGPVALLRLFDFQFRDGARTHFLQRQRGIKFGLGSGRVSLRFLHRGLCRCAAGFELSIFASRC